MKPTLTARAAALRFRLAGREDGATRRAAAAALPAIERPLFLELVQGLERRRLTLERVLASRGDRGRLHLSRVAHAAGLLGIYQILFLDGMPEHAAVDATVDLVPPRDRGRGFVNAALRGLLRDRRPIVGDPSVIPATRRLRIGPDRWVDLGRPTFTDPAADPLAWLAEHEGFETEAAALFIREFGAELAARILAQANERPRLVLRRSDAALDDETFVQELAEEGLRVRPLGADHPALFVRESGGDPAETAAFRRGAYLVQGPFAARVADFVALREDEVLIDLCAAPGTKSVVLAGQAPRGRVVACVLDASGAAAVEENARRLGLENVAVARIEAAGPVPTVAKATALLVDAPCSNSGVLARRPGARRRLGAGPLAELETLQMSLLDRALTWLEGAPARSRLVWSTCSIFERENGGLLRRALEGRPNLVLAAEIRDLPLRPEDDGGYAARIEKRPGA